MKFAKLVKGTADVRPVELALPGLAEPIKIGQRPLTALEETDVIAKAREFAKSKGVDKPTDDDPLYVMGAWANTLLLACQAHEDLAFTSEDGSVTTYKKGEPIFSSIDEILSGLDRDRISYLYEMQQRVQEDHGCRKERLTVEEMMAATYKIATSEVGDPDLPFWKWGPSARASYMQHLASLLFFSQEAKSPPGSPSSSASTNATPNPE